ncbi:MAG: hypothetical protein CMH98_01235 [Oceanospirillaceae bacterium]|nr:hypothetical protein [Oceanospirillaceae bacterium]
MAQPKEQTAGAGAEPRCGRKASPPRQPAHDHLHAADRGLQSCALGSGAGTGPTVADAGAGEAVPTRPSPSVRPPASEAAGALSDGADMGRFG